MLHKEAVTNDLLGILKDLCTLPELRGFRLVGGTAVALYFGHRRSVDIDFFTNEKTDRKTILGALRLTFPGAEFFVTEHSISSEIKGVKLDIFDDWSVPFQNSPVTEEGLRIASLTDLVAFKLNAITERREKKDYVDLYFLLQNLGSEVALESFQNSNPLISVKSLLFALTEVTTARSNKSPMPDMLSPVSWLEIEKVMVNTAQYALQKKLANGNP